MDKKARNGISQDLERERNGHYVTIKGFTGIS